MKCLEDARTHAHTDTNPHKFASLHFPSLLKISRPIPKPSKGKLRMLQAFFGKQIQHGMQPGGFYDPYPVSRPAHVRPKQGLLVSSTAAVLSALCRRLCLCANRCSLPRCGMLTATTLGMHPHELCTKTPKFHYVWFR